MLLNKVFLCRWKSPRAHSASELKYLQLMNEMCHHSFHLVSPYGPLLSHSHTHTHAPHWWDNLILMVIFYSYLDRDSSFFFSFLRIISADHSSSHYFSSDYLKHLGIMKPWDMEKSFSLFSIHVSATNPRSLASPLHLFILCLMSNTILKLSVTSSQLSVHVTFYYCQNQPVGPKSEASPSGAALSYVRLNNTEQHWVVCLSGGDTEQTEDFQTSGWPWTSVISPSGAADPANCAHVAAMFHPI